MVICFETPVAIVRVTSAWAALVVAAQAAAPRVSAILFNVANQASNFQCKFERFWWPFGVFAQFRVNFGCVDPAHFDGVAS